MKSFLQGTGKAGISLPLVVMMRRAATSGMAFMGKDNEDDILKLVTEIVAAYVSKNPVAASEPPSTRIEMPVR